MREGRREGKVGGRDKGELVDTKAKSNSKLHIRAIAKKPKYFIKTFQSL